MLRCFATEIQPGKAEHDSLPKAAECGSVNPAGRIAHAVSQIDLGRLMEITFRQSYLAKTSRDERVNCRAERTSMTAARLVVFKIHPSNLGRQAVPEQMDKHHNIRLLDDLGTPNAVATKQHIHWVSAELERRKVDIIEFEITLELFEEPRLGVETGMDITSHP